MFTTNMWVWGRKWAGVKSRVTSSSKEPDGKSFNPLIFYPINMKIGRKVHFYFLFFYPFLIIMQFFTPLFLVKFTWKFIDKYILKVFSRTFINFWLRTFLAILQKIFILKSNTNNVLIIWLKKLIKKFKKDLGIFRKCTYLTNLFLIGHKLRELRNCSFPTQFS